jgi:hypothetical protein
MLVGLFVTAAMVVVSCDENHDVNPGIDIESQMGQVEASNDLCNGGAGEGS